ncbi:MAG: hypothetical protein BWK79_08660 [Beggiatoa sp. IS2]|nr:MAG: hypothetical protein BWK79_08660 [Beggiatoa sp. IS2]
MLSSKTFLIIWFSFLLNACVTINIYFPAAAAEKAADQIINEVWGQQSDDKDKGKPPVTDDKAPHSSTSTPIYGWILELFIPTAQALADAELDISSPAIQSLKNRMAERHKQLAEFYDSGAIGLTADALIILREPGKVPLKSRNNVNRGLAEENQDRLALYREIAIANNHPEWESNIRATFATRWIERAQTGWWYQNAEGKWQRKQ